MSTPCQRYNYDAAFVGTIKFGYLKMGQSQYRDEDDLRTEFPAKWVAACYD